VFDAFEGATGIHPEDADANMDSITHHGQAIAKPLFDKVRALPGPVMTPMLSSLLKRGRVQTALKSVAEDMDTDGIDPASQGINLKDPSQSRPTVLAWDMIRRHFRAQMKIDGMGRMLPESSAPGNTSIGSAVGVLTKELRTAIPGFGDALDAGGDYLSIGSAFRDGQKVVDGTKFTPHTISQMVDKLQPGDRYGFYTGIASKLFGKAGAENVLATSGPLQAKIIAALGPVKGSVLIDTAKAELAAMRTGNRMVPRNQAATAGIGQNILDQDQIDRAHNVVDAAHAIGHVVLGGPAGIITAAGPALRMAQRMSKAGRMPEDARNAAGHLMLLPPSNTAAHLQRVRPVSGMPPPMSQQTLRALLAAYVSSKQASKQAQR
jgi:hypothetical protein